MKLIQQKRSTTASCSLPQTDKKRGCVESSMDCDTASAKVSYQLQPKLQFVKDHFTKMRCPF